MAQQLELDNFGSLNIVDATDRLDADVAAGASTIQNQNTANYIPGQYVVIGPLGSELAEMRVVSSIVDATHLILTQGLALKHDRFEPITPLNGNQIKIYRALNGDGHVPADTSFVYLSTVGINVTDMVSIYTDQSGGAGYWYKSTYFNAATNFETSLGDSTVARGGGYSYYCSVYDIRRTAGLINNQYITNADIDEKRLEAQQEIDASLAGMYTVPFQAPIDPMISGITRLLAAGKLMMDDPGGSGGNSTIYQEGQDKMTEARTMLDMINSRKYFLTDTTGQTIISPNSQTSKAFPDANTPNLAPSQGGSERLFRMSDVSNDQNTRRY